MSPPQIDLNSKASKPPSIIIQGNDTRQEKQQCTRKVKIIAATVILIIGGITFGAIAYNYRLFYKSDYAGMCVLDGEHIPKLIHVDYKKEIIYVNNNQTGRIDGMKALYNYNRKLVALYDETHNICLIDKVDQSFGEGLNYWSNYKGVDSSKKFMKFEYSRQPIDKKVLYQFGGEEISNHCGNATAYWVLRSNNTLSQEDRNELDNDEGDEADKDQDEYNKPETVDTRVKRSDGKTIVLVIIYEDVVVVVVIRSQ